MALQAESIVVRHHPTLAPVLDQVSLTVHPGELVAIVGANGSGKSTLARALVGLVPLESGRVHDGSGARPRVGLVVQDPASQLVAVTVADEIAAGPEAAGVEAGAVAARVTGMLDRHQLTGLAAREPGRLSGGQQQRVAIAAVDACSVDVLVVDEPCALLDQPARERIRARLHASSRADGRGVVWITQEPDDVAWCDRVVVLDAGVLVWSGTVGAWMGDDSPASTWGLELPSAARIYRELRDRGVRWNGPAPRTLDALATMLGSGAS